jgi:outer membrane receptor protein involved in Fe transport
VAIILHPAYGQSSRYSIGGKIIHEDNSLAVGATVALLNARDSSRIRSSICSKEGAFKFSNIVRAKYLLLITEVGYKKTYTGPYDLTGNVDAGIIMLVLENTQLGEVKITGKKYAIEAKGDKTVLNVSQNISADGTSVFDFLRTAPGVRINNDEILYKGGQRALIAINGKPVALTEDALANLLKSLPSNTISQIELLNSPSAKYDASSAGGVINIILKKSKEMGSTGSVTATAAAGDKYKFNTGASWNYRNPKFDLFANYNFQDNKIRHYFSNYRNIYDGDQLNSFDLDYSSVTTSHNHVFTAGADYNLNAAHTIGALVTGFANGMDIDKNNVTHISTNHIPDSSITANSNIDRRIVNLNYNLNYKGKLDKEGKSFLSADLDYYTYNRHSTENIQNDFYDVNGVGSSPPLYFQNQSPSKIHIRTENIAFQQYFTKTSSLEFGVKNNEVNSNNNIDFEQKINGNYVPVQSLTNNFTYHEQINAGFVNFVNKTSKTGLTLGLRAEQTTSSAIATNPQQTVNADYFNLFPNVRFDYNVDDNNLLGAHYSRNIVRPNYQDLNPFVTYVDQYYYSTGNPFLKPQYVNRLQFTELYKNKYRADLSYIVSNDFIGSVFVQNDSTKAYGVTKGNVHVRYQYMAELSIPADLTSWWSINTYLKGSYEKFRYELPGAEDKTTFDFVATLDQQFTITPKFTAQVFAFYESPTYFLISQYKESYVVNAGLSYAMLNGKGKLTFNARDIFNSEKDRYHTAFLNLDLTAVDKIPTRFFGLTFTYNFGNLSLKSSQKNKSSEEQRRLRESSEN